LIAGSLAAGNVPLEMFAAFKAFVVALAANGTPPVVVTVVAQVPALLVASPVSAGSLAQSTVPVSLVAAKAVIHAGFE
jgi:hypothetical protein